MDYLEKLDINGLLEEAKNLFIVCDVYQKDYIDTLNKEIDQFILSKVLSSLHVDINYTSKNSLQELEQIAINKIGINVSLLRGRCDILEETRYVKLQIQDLSKGEYLCPNTIKFLLVKTTGLQGVLNIIDNYIPSVNEEKERLIIIF